ncbi:MAG: hypothetical protein IT542_09945 [Rubellimicrobium sp.]|nr:hypothetical protein [Rubellimicrobium sp.]
MTHVLTGLVVAAFLALAGGVVYLWLRLSETSRREALQALAARRGWALTISSERLGQPGMLRLSPRGGPAWTVETRAQSSLAGAGLPGRGRHATDYLAEDPRWEGGTLILAPALPAGDAREAVSGAEAAVRRILAQLPGRAPSGAGRLSVWPGPPGATLLCTQDPAARLDPADLGRALAAYAPEGAGRPVVVFGPEGLRLHLPGGVHRADQMERFIDLAHELTRIL